MLRSSSRTLKHRNRIPRQRWTPERASTVLAKHAASGLTIQKFAAREGLDPERLYRLRVPENLTTAVPENLATP